MLKKQKQNKLIREIDSLAPDSIVSSSVKKVGEYVCYSLEWTNCSLYGIAQTLTVGPFQRGTNINNTSLRRTLHETTQDSHQFGAFTFRHLFSTSFKTAIFLTAHRFGAALILEDIEKKNGTDVILYSQWPELYRCSIIVAWFIFAVGTVSSPRRAYFLPF